MNIFISLFHSIKKVNYSYTDPVIQASSFREITTLYQNILKEATTLKQDVMTSETISDFPITHVISTSYAVDIAETTPIYVSTTQILPTTVDQIIESSADYNSKHFSQYLKPSSSYISLVTSSLSKKLNTSQSQTTDQTDISTFTGINIPTNTATPVQRIYGMLSFLSFTVPIFFFFLLCNFSTK